MSHAGNRIAAGNPPGCRWQGGWVTDTIVKRREDAPPGFFAAEAAGLAWLGAAGGAPVVDVLEVDDHAITLRRLPERRPDRRAVEEFAHALARTHAAGADAFGVGPAAGPGVAWIGRQQLSLAPSQTWGTFYAQHRLLPYAAAARELGHLSAADLTAVERVAARLEAGEFDDGRPAARIHGDLWAGNVLWTPAGVLIDPAAHGGHGETDLAMLALFGAPELPRLQAAYAEAAQLDSRWPDRVGLHQLHPLLVHAVSHGGSYGVQAGRIARHYA